MPVCMHASLQYNYANWHASLSVILLSRMDEQERVVGIISKTNVKSPAWDYFGNKVEKDGKAALQ